MKNIKDMKWLKLGAAAFLSVGLLTGCVDDDDGDVDVITPPGEVDENEGDVNVTVPPGDVDENDGTDADVDVNVDEDVDDKTNDDGK